jgi:hypothetical protein
MPALFAPDAGRSSLVRQEGCLPVGVPAISPEAYHEPRRTAASHDDELASRIPCPYRRRRSSPFPPRRDERSLEKGASLEGAKRWWILDSSCAFPSVWRNHAGAARVSTSYPVCLCLHASETASRQHYVRFSLFNSIYWCGLCALKFMKEQCSIYGIYGPTDSYSLHLHTTL